MKRQTCSLSRLNTGRRSRLLGAAPDVRPSRCIRGPVRTAALVKNYTDVCVHKFSTRTLLTSDNQRGGGRGVISPTLGSLSAPGSCGGLAEYY